MPQFLKGLETNTGDPKEVNRDAVFSHNLFGIRCHKFTSWGHSRIIRTPNLNFTWQLQNRG